MNTSAADDDREISVVVCIKQQQSLWEIPLSLQWTSGAWITVMLRSEHLCVCAFLCRFAWRCYFYFQNKLDWLFVCECERETDRDTERERE